jgi:hypothetical protein
MIDFGSIDAAYYVTDKWILSKLDDAQIFYYYFGHFELNKAYPSKFRRDSNPSTGFYISKTGAIIYNDLRTGEKLNCFNFVRKLFNIPYKDALNRIATDFGLIRGNTKPLAQKILDQTVKFDRELKKDTIIQIEPCAWNSTHLTYWKQYEVTKSELVREEVYPVKNLYLNKFHYKTDELCFAYTVHEKVGKEIKKTYLKIYQPYSETRKWMTNVPLTVPFGLHNLKYGTDKIMIGKAQKDRLCLLKLFPSVIGTQNESPSAIPDSLVKHLCFNFPERVIVWDADETGVENCKKFNERGFGYFNTPRELLPQGIKDISDYIKAFGLKALEKLFKEKQLL